MHTLSNLTAQERRALLVELQLQQDAEEAQRDAEIAAYKRLASQAVLEHFPQLQVISRELAKQKKRVRESFQAILELKAGVFGVKEGQRSHQFINKNGTQRIAIGYNIIDNYDDTVNVGIAMVRHYITSLARDTKSQMLVETILKLLARDSKGTLKASRVLQLQELAEKSGSGEFLEGVKIIRKAYRPIESKSYIRAEYKDLLTGAWRQLPLGMTEADE